MKPPSDTRSPKNMDPWAPYVPSERFPWNLRRVVHLHRRAGFAATWGEIERDLREGPETSLDRVLAGKAATQGVPCDFEKTADLLGSRPSPRQIPLGSSHGGPIGCCSGPTR